MSPEIVQFARHTGLLESEHAQRLRVQGEEGLIVIRATAVLSVVTMVPFGEQVQGRPAQFFSIIFSFGVVGLHRCYFKVNREYARVK
jgi:hypothetical protein